MRYLDVTVSQSPDDRDPMHQFIVDHEDYGTTRMLEREPLPEGRHAALFHVEGPREPYASVLADRSGTEAVAISACADETCYVYVRETVPERDRSFADAFAQPGLLVVMPVEFRPDGTVGVTAVGPASAIGTAVEAVPETMGVEVRSVGSYDAGPLDSRFDLTQRQREAVAAAVETGYYSAPREATLTDVADRLDCASGTAGELLRRAERTVMSNLVSRGGREPDSW